MLRDNYPKGIKGEPKLSDLLTQLKDTNISYVFGQVGLDLVKGELAVLLEREKYQNINLILLSSAFLMFHTIN